MNDLTSFQRSVRAMCKFTLKSSSACPPSRSSSRRIKIGYLIYYLPINIYWILGKQEKVVVVAVIVSRFFCRQCRKGRRVSDYLLHFLKGAKRPAQHKNFNVLVLIGYLILSNSKMKSKSGPLLFSKMAQIRFQISSLHSPYKVKNV